MLPEQYGVIASPSDTSVATFSSLAAINFSGHTIAGVRSAFTVGGWVRRAQTGVLQTVFLAPQQFSMVIDADGWLLSSLFSGENLRHPTQITDSAWHYVAASFAQDPADEGAGFLSLYVDGFPTAGETSAGDTLAQGTCTLGDTGRSHGIEYASWCLWSQALAAEALEVPLWGVPAGDSALLTGLLAAFDFAGPSVVSSNPAITITPAEHRLIRPCLALSGFAAPGPAVYAPGNAGAWSLLLWIRVPAEPASAGSFVAFTNGGTGQPGERPDFTVAVNPALPQSIEISRKAATGDRQVLLTAACDLTVWSHLALTGDGQELRLYLDGNLVATAGPFAFTDSLVQATLGIGSTSAQGTSGFLQSVSIWNRTVGADELAGLADVMAPETDGLQALFPLLADGRDAVGGNDLNLVGAAFTNDESVTPGSASRAVSALADWPVPTRRAVASATEARILQAQDYRDLAAKLGIEAPSRSARDITQASDFGDWYQSAYFQRPEPLRSALIQRFDRDYRLGLALRSRGVMPGRVVARTEGGQTIFDYHTIDGVEEVFRRDLLLTPNEIWAITITMDVLFVGLAVAGVVTTPRAVGSAVRPGRLARVMPSIMAAIRNAGPGPSGAMMVVGNVINILSNAGLMLSIIWNIITASWWDLVFVGLSILASILSLIFAPTSVGWRLANTAIALANLAFDLTLKPPQPEA